MDTTDKIGDLLGSETPMEIDLLELPDSVFELFEEDKEHRSTFDLNSSFCSTNDSSRWLSELDDIDAIINEDSWGDDSNFTVKAVENVAKPSVMSIFGQKQCIDAEVQTDGTENIPDYEGPDPLTIDDIQSKSKFRELSECSSRPSSSNSSKRSQKSRKSKERHVLHFLLDLLQDDSCGSLIYWVDQPKGIFRIEKSGTHEIVALWNRKKTTCVKDWNNFARTLRNHYRGEKFLEPIREQYTYKFSREFLSKHVF